ncbi:MAG TPA: tRNA preQ1(34) S-adenosylmethionine ribosyltransferase-isomerase QueA [Gemmatimonadetes bacterium]|nr:tRNA preQ1(34) S-adenosylmethionine ribosyltransferase-isomerase QueA [Gemmatimonadota bacterium]
MKDGSRVSDYEYELPPGRIARYPTERRDQSRLLVVPPGEAPLEHRVFSDLVDLLNPGDVLVVNESRVTPARLLGRKPTGAPSEVLLLRPLGAGDATGSSLAHDEATLWEALVRPGGKLKPGRVVNIAPGFDIEIVDGAAGGGRIVRLVVEGSVREALERYGHVPLPPYLDRDDEALDRERYQTVYARVPGSVAAPTAGLHFTPELLDRIDGKGVERVAVTLDVGVGTFRPVEADDPADHEMHSERYCISSGAAGVINRARQEGRCIWAVGTTVVRTLESADHKGVVGEGVGRTDLFVRPPYRFQVVDRLITNFHLPRSTLLMLVAALGGYQRTMEAYDTAIREGYRFYSYGDAMLMG